MSGKGREGRLAYPFLVVIDVSGVDTVPLVSHSPDPLHVAVGLDDPLVVVVAVEVLLVLEAGFPQNRRRATVLLVEGEEHHVAALPLGHVQPVRGRRRLRLALELRGRRLHPVLAAAAEVGAEEGDASVELRDVGGALRLGGRSLDRHLVQHLDRATAVGPVRAVSSLRDLSGCDTDKNVSLPVFVLFFLSCRGQLGTRDVGRGLGGWYELTLVRNYPVDLHVAELITVVIRLFGIDDIGVTELPTISSLESGGNSRRGLKNRGCKRPRGQETDEEYGREHCSVQQEQQE